MPFCTNCGGQVADSANFCTHCGVSTRSGAASAPSISLSASKAARINEEWNALAPADWGVKKHADERALLEGLLEDSESLAGLVSGSFGPEGELSHINLGVATDHRLIFLRQTKRAPEVVSLPYDTIESISFKTGWMGGSVKVISRYKGGYRMDSIQPKERAELFAETVQPHLAPVSERSFAATEPVASVAVEVAPVPINETVPVAVEEPVSAAADDPGFVAVSKAARIDQEWASLALGLGHNKHVNERGMLNPLLDDDESLKCLVSGLLSGTEGSSNTYLGVATDRRIVFLRKEKRSNKVVELPYSDITVLTHSSNFMGGTLKVSAQGKGRFEVSNINPKKQPELFVEAVQPYIAAAQAGNPAKISKEDRIDQEWEALIPKGWGTFGDKGMHSGERNMLHNLLEDDETLECLVGGKFGPDLGRSHIAKDKSLHSGVGVATDRRVIFIDAGFLSAEVAELPYSSIETISYSTGFAKGGLKIAARGATSLQMEMIQPMGQAKLFADAVRKRLNAGPTVAAPTVVQTASAMDELEKAAALYERGLLTPEEFAAKKAQLLNS